jgi:hypothetical protein
MTVIPPAQRVQGVVGILSPKSGKDDSLLIRDTIPIGVFEMQQLGALAHVNTAVSRLNGAGN